MSPSSTPGWPGILVSKLLRSTSGTTKCTGRISMNTTTKEEQDEMESLVQSMHSTVLTERSILTCFCNSKPKIPEAGEDCSSTEQVYISGPTPSTIPPRNSERSTQSPIPPLKQLLTIILIGLRYSNLSTPFDINAPPKPIDHLLSPF